MKMLLPRCERDLASSGSVLQGFPNSSPCHELDELTPFGTTDGGCCCSPPAAGLVVGGAFLFEDLATAKHGVSLLCRDDGGGGGER